MQYYRDPDIRRAHLLLHPSPANCPTGGIAEERYILLLPNEDQEGDALGQQEDTRQGKEVLLVLTTKWRESLEGAHDAKEKVQRSPMTSLLSPTPISTTSSFLTLKRRKEEDPSLVLLMKQNSLSSSCPVLWMKREDEPTTSPPLGLPGIAGTAFLVLLQAHRIAFMSLAFSLFLFKRTYWIKGIA